MTDSSNDFDLLNSFAHDLKTPLGAVKSYIQLIEQFGELNERQEHYSERAMLAVERMEQIIRELLEFARMEADPTLEIVELGLEPLIRDAVHMLEDIAAQSDITINIDIKPGLSRVQGDMRMLSHVISNLLSNAIKYNRDGGDVHLRASNDGAFVRLDVRDTGLGIPAEQQERVFERFFRAEHTNTNAKIDGTGLGLAIVKNVVQRHGGEITLKSKVNEGTTFTVLLPRADVNVDGEDTRENAPNLGSQPPSTIDMPLMDGASEPDDGLDDSFQEAAEINEDDSSSDHL